jgi:hypothetical protein
MKIDKFHTQVDKLIEKIDALDFEFKDETLQVDFAEIKADAVSLLEELVDMASTEAEIQEENEE